MNFNILRGMVEMDCCASRKTNIFGNVVPFLFGTCIVDVRQIFTVCKEAAHARNTLGQVNGGQIDAALEDIRAGHIFLAKGGYPLGDDHGLQLETIIECAIFDVAQTARKGDVIQIDAEIKGVHTDNGYPLGDGNRGQSDTVVEHRGA